MRCLISVHGGWSDWTPWDLCSSSCGQGIQRRERTCNSPTPSSGGQHCFGDSSQYKTCTDIKCDGTVTLFVRIISNVSYKFVVHQYNVFISLWIIEWLGCLLLSVLFNSVYNSNYGISRRLVKT